MDEISFGECPVCRQGSLIAVKSRSTGRVLVMCDDCQSQWNSPHEAQSYKAALSREIDDVEPASETEIRAAGWVL